MTATDHIVVLDQDRGRARSIVELLEQTRPWTNSHQVLTFDSLRDESGDAAGLDELRSGLPVLVIAVDGADPLNVTFPGLLATAREQGFATLIVVGPDLDDPKQLASKVRGFDGWVMLESIERELPSRVAEILDRADRRSSASKRLPAIDPRFLAMIVHDLRTPLNVIGLIIRAITQTMPDRSAELDEDLTFLKENAGQIEKMLSQLGDYCRLIEVESRMMAAEFDPRRFLADFLEVYRLKPGSDASPVKLELTETSPIEVSLDQHRVKLALQHALANALIAAGKTPVRIRSSGSQDRWVIELIVDKPPPQTVVSQTLRADLFERLAGSAAERRGLDLAIVAHISELFGGTASLIVEPDRRSSILLDWPQRLADE